MLNPADYQVLSFDCYGTLIDWENGILRALRPVFKRHGITRTDNEILDLYAQLESEAEAGPFRNYRAIQQSVVAGLGQELGFEPGKRDLNCLARSVSQWLPFPDTVKALQKLKTHYRLAIISNIDNDLISHSLKHLKVEFDWVITAQELKAYKPSPVALSKAFRRIGVPQGKILHVAQSIFHDIVPVSQLGIATVWINRRKNIEGFGATPPAYARPDLELADLRSLADFVTDQQKAKRK